MALYTVQTTYPPAAQDLNQAIALLSGQSGPMAGGITIANRIRAQLAGATATSGLVGMTAVNGATTGGPPATGTWALGDLMVDPVLICLWVCVAAGTPGTWYRIGSGNTAGGLIAETSNNQVFTTRSGRTGFDIKLFDFVSGAGIGPMPGSSATLAAITAQYPGTYLFQGVVTLGGGTAGADIAAMILKNGQVYSFGSQFLGYGSPIITATELVTVAVGDVVQLGVYSEGTYSSALTNAQMLFYGTFMSN